MPGEGSVFVWRCFCLILCGYSICCGGFRTPVGYVPYSTDYYIDYYIPAQIAPRTWHCISLHSKVALRFDFTSLTFENRISILVDLGHCSSKIRDVAIPTHRNSTSANIPTGAYIGKLNRFHLCVDRVNK